MYHFVNNYTVTLVDIFLYMMSYLFLVEVGGIEPVIALWYKNLHAVVTKL